MTKYEVMYIVKANLDEEAVKAVNEEMQAAFTSTGSEVLEVKDYGLKDLAYEIEGQTKGQYVWFNVLASGESCKEFTRRANINENVIRHIVVRDER
jgi:small subunit ribosomal protein S6